jgi:uroporphyrinogen-III synthase
MRVLVTRPASSGARTARKLEAHGHEALLLPLTEAVHDPDTAQAALAATRGPIAITSAEAIRALQPLGAALAPHLQRSLFAVGKATADEAAKAGFATIFHTGSGGEELADLIAAEQSILADWPLTYLAGTPRAAGLEARLAHHGIAVNVFECYRMMPVDPSDAALQEVLGHPPADAILFYSSHSAERFFGLDFIGQRIDLLKNIRLLCLSATIATIVPYGLQSQMEIASTPEEDSLLGLLGNDAGSILR